MNEQILSVTECATLGKKKAGSEGRRIIRQTIYNHCRLGNIPHLIQDGHYFIKESDFLPWLDRYLDGEFKPNGSPPLKFDFNKPAKVIAAKSA
jgi:hypothetical protein